MKRLAILGAFVLAGCPSFTTMGTARTVTRDTTQTWVAPEFVGVAIDTGTGTESLSVPQFEFGVRRGITDGVELGAKLWFLGAAFESKFQLLRSEVESSGIDVALAPAIGWLGFNSGDVKANLVTGYLSLPVGINVYGGSQFVLTPKAIYMRAFSDDPGNSINFLFVGGSVAYAWKLGTVYILPEISVMQPAIQGDRGDFLYFDGAFFQGGIGLLFGG